jgi:hypothetical protein
MSQSSSEEPLGLKDRCRLIRSSLLAAFIRDLIGASLVSAVAPVAIATIKVPTSTQNLSSWM